MSEPAPVQTPSAIAPAPQESAPSAPEAAPVPAVPETTGSLDPITAPAGEAGEGLQAEAADRIETAPSSDMVEPVMAEPVSAAPIETAALAAEPAMAAPVVEAPAIPAQAAMAAPEPASSLLASAEARLPAEARGALPAAPEKIGPEALRMAAAKGEPMALFEVGLRMMEGRAGPSDPKAALAWFGQSAARGYAPAQYSVGTLFEKGNGVPRDTGAARDWYRLAADQGNIRAMHNLAVLYATGIEGASEPKTAADWFLRAAQHGMRDSQYNLGILYARGVGVDQDLGESYRWFRIVGAAGDKDAQSKMEEVGKTLAPEERARIDAEIAAWKPEPRIDAVNTVNVPANWNEAAGQSASVDMSKAIRNVQAILLKLGYNPGRPDGVVGAQTQSAIRKFQEKTGLQATGQIDEPLIRALLERKDA
jgi:localization factor PodJL